MVLMHGVFQASFFESFGCFNFSVAIFLLLSMHLSVLTCIF